MTALSRISRRALGGHGQTVLSVDLAFRETCGQRQSPVEKRHSFAHHGKSVHVFLLIVQDVGLNGRPPEPPHFEHALGIVRKEFAAQAACPASPLMVNPSAIMNECFIVISP